MFQITMGFAALYPSYVFVIASEAKQSSVPLGLDCFVAPLLAMTIVPTRPK
jgi:hypothetical protein